MFAPAYVGQGSPGEARSKVCIFRPDQKSLTIEVIEVTCVGEVEEFYCLASTASFAFVYLEGGFGAEGQIFDKGEMVVSSAAGEKEGSSDRPT
jgi:hypothetical protein